jgi:hypothetical protein
MGGRLVGAQRDRFAGTSVNEIAYAWRDLELPLVRRRLAPEAD